MKAKDLTVMALLTAALTGGKAALAFLPNIEIVTLLLITYALVLGWRRVFVISLIFVLIECFIWGFGWWVPIYLVYWPALATAVSVLPKTKWRIPLAILTGILFTVSFGAISTLIEISLTGAIGSGRFGEYFSYRYISGVSFFVTHIVSNSIILPVMTPVLYAALNKLYNSYYKGGNNGGTFKQGA